MKYNKYMHIKELFFIIVRTRVGGGGGLMARRPWRGSTCALSLWSPDTMGAKAQFQEAPPTATPTHPPPPPRRGSVILARNVAEVGVERGKTPVCFAGPGTRTYSKPSHGRLLSVHAGIATMRRVKRPFVTATLAWKAQCKTCYVRFTNFWSK